MGVDARTKQIVWTKAGGVCSFPGCERYLVKDATPDDREVLVGEIAHIVGQGEQHGPRHSATVPGGDIHGEANLILFCHECHELVDQQEHTYPVDRLLQFKKDHEEWVRTCLSRDRLAEDLPQQSNMVTETVFSTLLPVRQIPHNVYSGILTVPKEEIGDHILWPHDKRILLPYVIQGDMLYSFVDMRVSDSPFTRVVDRGTVEKHSARDWWDQPDEARLFTQLLNRTLNKITGRLGLRLDKEHHRYYFEPDEPGVEKRVEYKSLTGRQPDRAVAWNPHTKITGEPKKHWEHLAVGLRFHRVGPELWALAIRPERRFTTDGFTPLVSKAIGRKSTKRKSRMYNIDLLKEVQFWRDYLSSGEPRIICIFGRQTMVIDNELLSTSITWPEIPGDHIQRMTVKYEENLFTWADLAEASDLDDFDDADELDEVEEDDFFAD